MMWKVKRSSEESFVWGPVWKYSQQLDRVNRCAIWSNFTGNIQFQFFYKKVKQILKSKILLLFTFLRLVKSDFFFFFHISSMSKMRKVQKALKASKHHRKWRHPDLIRFSEKTLHLPVPRAHTQIHIHVLNEMEQNLITTSLFSTLSIHL